MQRLRIDPQQFAQLSELLDTAFDLPPNEREQWLAALDARYEPLKAQLRELLACAAQIETDDFLNTLPKLEASARELELASERAGECFGSYRLIRELGAGGMGSVWLAERTDGLIKRPVALKLPHVASRRVGLAERMAREREILAALAHPHIARLYDAGVTPEGRPYLALEYVEGKPIDVYCEERQLDVHARLRLFLQVANAVAYAHAKLIIHRDLKPANILVTSDGEVRLLDFGVAKLLDDGQAHATQLTELSGRALTLDYASPEQILGQPLTIATDVYSLGVVLYELLTGAKPYRLKRDSRGALEDAIVHGDPPKPSEAANPSRRKPLKGDLDTIILKALKKAPQERYATVNALADDISLHLQRRPVLAQPDKVSYRVRKFASRNRFAVAASMAVLAAIVGGASLALWQARVALEERDRAEQVKNLIASVFQQADPYSADRKETTALELLHGVKARVQQMRELPPLTRIELLTLVGDSLKGLEDYASARDLLNLVANDAEASLGADHPMTLHARLLLVETLRFAGETAAMETMLRDLIPLLETSTRVAPRDLVKARTIQAHLAIDTGRYAEAVAFAKLASEIAAANMEPTDDDVLSAAMLHAVVLQYQDDADAALKVATDAHAIAVRVYQHGDQDHPRLLDARAIYGRALGNAGQLRSAIEVLEGVVAALQADRHRARTMLGYYAADLAKYQLQIGDITGALTNSETAFAAISATVLQDSYTYAAAAHRRAQALAAARRLGEAIALFDRSVPGLVASLGPQHPRTISAWADRAIARTMMEDFADAADAPAEVANLPDGARAKISAALAHRYYRLGRHAEAIASYQSGLSLARADPDLWREAAELQYGLGLVQLAVGEMVDAATSLQAAHDALVRNESPLHPFYADVLIALGRAYLAQEPARACPLFARSDAFWRDFDPENRYAGEAALWLGRCYRALGRSTEAYAALERATTILARSPIRSDAELVRLARNEQLP